MHALSTAAINRKTVGELGTTEFRLEFERDGQRISPWHDIPLRNGEFFNYVNEVKICFYAHD